MGRKVQARLSCLKAAGPDAFGTRPMLLGTALPLQPRAPLLLLPLLLPTPPTCLLPLRISVSGPPFPSGPPPPFPPFPLLPCLAQDVFISDAQHGVEVAALLCGAPHPHAGAVAEEALNCSQLRLGSGAWRIHFVCEGGGGGGHGQDQYSKEEKLSAAGSSGGKGGMDENGDARPNKTHNINAGIASESRGKRGGIQQPSTPPPCSAQAAYLCRLMHFQRQALAIGPPMHRNVCSGKVAPSRQWRQREAQGCLNSCRTMLLMSCSQQQQQQQPPCRGAEQR